MRKTDDSLYKSLIFSAAREIHQLDKNNGYIRTMIKGIEPDFFFDVLDSLFDMIDRQTARIKQLTEEE